MRVGRASLCALLIGCGGVPFGGSGAPFDAAVADVAPLLGEGAQRRSTPASPPTEA